MVKLKTPWTWSVSSVKCAQTCPRLWKYKYLDRRVPKGYMAPLAMGSYFHAALAKYFGNPGPLTEWSDEIELTDWLKTVGMYLAYKQRWPRDKDKFEVLEIEKKHWADIAGSDRMITIRDGIVRMPDGRVMILEHKTTSFDMASDYGVKQFTQGLDMDLQPGVYAAHELTYGPVAGVIYDVVTKPKLKKGRSEGKLAYVKRCRDWVLSKPARLRRFVLAITPEQSEAAMADLEGYAKLTRANAEAGLFPRNTQSCYKYYRACDYMPVCNGETGIDNDDLFRDK